MPVNLEGLTPIRVLRMGGQCDWDDPIQIPNGLALICQNMAFLAESVKSRWGMQIAAAATATGNPTGVDVLTVLGEPITPNVTQQAGGASRTQGGIVPQYPPVGTVYPGQIDPNTQVGIVFSDTGELWVELPAGSGTLVPLTDLQIAASIAALLPAAAVMQTAKAFNRIYQAFSNLVSSLGPVLALDAATGWESPVGQNPIAAIWQPSTFYQQGDIVTSSTNPAVWFRRLNTGYSGTLEPTWPIGESSYGYFTPGYVPVYAVAEDMSTPQNISYIIFATAVSGDEAMIYIYAGGFGDFHAPTPGQVFAISELSNAPWFNGQELTVTGVRHLGLFGEYYFTAAFTHADYAETADDGIAKYVTPESTEWQEWTAGYPTWLPTPAAYPGFIPTLYAAPGEGTIPAGQDVYVALAYYNDLGESIWTQPIVSLNTAANDKLTLEFDTINTASGPPMPSWLMSIMQLGTVAGLHWPSAQCLNVYVAAVTHGAAAPANFYLYGTSSADTALTISSIPVSGPQFTARTIATAAISSEQFVGEGGIRNAILLRQNSMGDLSAVDPQCVIPVTCNGGQSVPAQISVGAFTAGNQTTTIPSTYASIEAYSGFLTDYPPGSLPGVITIVPAGTSATFYAQLAKVVGGVEVAWSPVLGPFNVGYVNLGGFSSLATMELVLPGDGLEDSWTVYFGNTATSLTQKIAGIPNNITEYFIATLGNQGTLPPAQFMYCLVDDVTPWAAGMQLSVQNPIVPAWNGTYPLFAIYPSQGVSWSGSAFTGDAVGFPGGTLVFFLEAGWPSNANPQAGTVSLIAGPCPVAIVPPGVQEGPGYAYDIVAFAVAGLGVDGPFNYLVAPTPANPYEVTVISETTDGNGNGTAVLSSVVGLTPGETVLISGWTGGNVLLNGLRVIATVGAQNNTVSFPDDFAVGTYQAPTGAVSMEVIQTEATQVAAGTVGILLQFDDETLPEGVDVTGNLLFVALPPCIDLAYLPSQQRMCYVSDTQPTSFLFSEVDFLGEMDGENDVLAVEQSNGARAIGARELLNGMIVGAKETGGYQIIPTADVPANWGVGRLWGGHGPWSGRNIGAGINGDPLDFFVFVDPDNGLYKWPPTLGQGELDWLSKELSGANNQDASRMATWDRVNRAAGQQIQVIVDSAAKEIKIAVPLDGATTPSHILTMSYFNGWQDPLMLTLSGEWVANRQARRWNIDPIPTRAMALVKRTLATPVDQRVNFRQLLIGQYAATPGDIELLYMEPGSYDDQGAGYLSKYRMAYAKDMPNPQNPGGGRLMGFAAYTGHMIGAGMVTIDPITPDPDYQIPTPYTRDLSAGVAQSPGSAPVTHIDGSLKADSEFLTIEFSNGGVADAWFQLIEVAVWGKAKMHTP